MCTSSFKEGPLLPRCSSTLREKGQAAVSLAHEGTEAWGLKFLFWVLLQRGLWRVFSHRTAASSMTETRDSGLGFYSIKSWQKFVYFKLCIFTDNLKLAPKRRKFHCQVSYLREVSPRPLSLSGSAKQTGQKQEQEMLYLYFDRPMSSSSGST